MKVSHSHGMYHFDSRLFTVKGVDFEIIGTTAGKDKKTIDSIKNLSNGKMSDVNRNFLAKEILKENHHVD